MKFNTLAAFKKHLQDAFPQHLSGIYLILMPEAESLAAEVIALKRRLFPDLQLFKLRPGDPELQSILRSGSLLGSHQLIWLKDVTEQEVEALLRYAKSPTPATTLLITGGGFKGKEALIDGMKREAITLDLTHEKPWDEEKRKKEWLFSLFKLQNKRVEAGVVELILERVGGDLQLLTREVEKLSTYVASRPDITKRDCELLTPQWTEPSLWKLAEAVVWGDGYPAPLHRCEVGDLLQLIGALRFQLQQGLLLHERKKSTFKPWAEERYTPVALRRPRTFFQEGLLLLLETEVHVKSSRGMPELLWERLLAHLTLKKHARTPA